MSPMGASALRPALPVPADQAWFWTEQWQQRERAVDEHVAAGRVAVHETNEDFLAHLVRWRRVGDHDVFKNP